MPVHSAACRAEAWAEAWGSEGVEAEEPGIRFFSSSVKDINCSDLGAGVHEFLNLDCDGRIREGPDFGCGHVQHAKKDQAAAVDSFRPIAAHRFDGDGGGDGGSQLKVDGAAVLWVNEDVFLVFRRKRRCSARNAQVNEDVDGHRLFEGVHTDCSISKSYRVSRGGNSHELFGHDVHLLSPGHQVMIFGTTRSRYSASAMSHLRAVSGVVSQEGVSESESSVRVTCLEGGIARRGIGLRG